MLDAIDLPPGLELRTARESDEKFLRQLFESTRTQLQQLPLPKAQISLLTEQQYHLQQAHYARQWPGAVTMVIYLSGQAVGRIMVTESEERLHIIDIALDSAARGKGCGTSIINALQDLGRERRLSLSLSVDRQNPKARRLYLALGFRSTGGSETHESMLWSPAAPATSNDSFFRTPEAGP